MLGLAVGTSLCYSLVNSVTIYCAHTKLFSEENGFISLKKIIGSGFRNMSFGK